MDPEPTRRVEELLADLGPAAGEVGAGECPADDLLVGLVQQRLPEPVSARLRTHLASCDDCRRLATTLADEPLVAEDRPETSHRARRLHRWPTYALAAAACIALGVAVTLIWRSPSGGPDPSTDTRLVAAARTLLASDSDLFEGFAVLGADERNAPYESPVERGALRLEMPRHTLLNDRPSFRWRAVPGAGTYRIVVMDEEGRELWTQDSSRTEMAYPSGVAALQPDAAYLWTVHTDGALGPVHGRAAFRVAGHETLRRFAEAQQTIATTVDPDLVPILEAHLAIRHDLLVYAWLLLDGPVVANADRVVMDETRTYLAQRLDLDPVE